MRKTSFNPLWTWVRRLVAVLAIAYPVALVVVVAAFRWIGERWWFTGVALYLPRVGFALPLPLVVACILATRQFRLLWWEVFAGWLILFPLMGLVVPFPGLTRPPGPSIRVLSLNANSFYAGSNVILSVIDRYNPDVVLMQEVGMELGDSDYAALQKRYPNVHRSTQFAIASRFPLSGITDPTRLPYFGRLRSPRYMRYVADTPLGPVVIYNVHPVSPRESFYRVRGSGLSHEILSGRFFKGASAPAVQENSGLRALQIEDIGAHARAEVLPVLIAGDTNLPGLSNVLAELAAGFRDGFREAGSGFGYSFPSHLPWMRIDRMLASDALRFSHFEVGCAGASDHLCILAEVRAQKSR